MGASSQRATHSLGPTTTVALAVRASVFRRGVPCGAQKGPQKEKERKEKEIRRTKEKENPGSYLFNKEKQEKQLSGH
jgi:hypothetical protein